MSATLKKENINVRIAPDAFDLIKRGAEASGKSVSAFVVEAASHSAEKALLDQRFFHLEPDVFDSIAELLSKPGEAHPGLQKLLNDPVKWATSKS